jgi:hypothetical protein
MQLQAVDSPKATALGLSNLAYEGQNDASVDVDVLIFAERMGQEVPLVLLDECLSKLRCDTQSCAQVDGQAIETTCSPKRGDRILLSHPDKYRKGRNAIAFNRSRQTDAVFDIANYFRDATGDGASREDKI